MIEAIIFDMDGLMFDTEELAIIGYIQACKHFGYDIRRERLIQATGLNTEDTKKIMTGFFDSKFPFEKVFEMKFTIINNIIDQNGIPIKKGLIELLDFCKVKGFQLAVATSSDRRRANYFLKSAGVFECFDAIVCGDEVVNGKPDPEIYLNTARKLNVSPENCMVLEDSENGLRAAKSARMIPIFIEDLVIENKMIKSCMQDKCKDLSEVINILKLLKT